jgi:hypothetical protein
MARVSSSVLGRGLASIRVRSGRLWEPVTGSRIIIASVGLVALAAACSRAPVGFTDAGPDDRTSDRGPGEADGRVGDATSRDGADDDDGGPTPSTLAVVDPPDLVTFMVLTSEHVFYATTQARGFVVPKSGGAPEAVQDGVGFGGGGDVVVNMAASPTTVAWATYFSLETLPTPCPIYEYRLADRSGVRVPPSWPVPGPWPYDDYDPVQVAFVEGVLYWGGKSRTAAPPWTLFRYDDATTVSTPVYTGDINLAGRIATNSRGLFVSPNFDTNRRLLWFPAAGGDPVELAQNVGHVAADTDHVYWTTLTGAIMSLRNDGASMATQLTDGLGAREIAVDDQDVWMVAGDPTAPNMIMRVSRAGGDPHPVYTGPSTPPRMPPPPFLIPPGIHALAVDDTHVYWADDLGVRRLEKTSIQ